MQNYSKLQIRAKVLSVISEIRSVTNLAQTNIYKFVEDLEQIEDRKTLFDVFVKEYIKMNEQEYMFSACLLKMLVPFEYMSDKVLESFKSTSLSDEAKYKLVQLLRLAGDNFTSNQIPEYFDNPNEVIDLETKKLLEKAVFNPEAMLDFLDFVSAVPMSDKSLLIKSLQLDYSGDMLANIIYPILYSDFEDEFVMETIEILAESKSPLAIAPFEYLIETSSNKEIISHCELGLKKLRLAGATKEKANEYFQNIINETQPTEMFATIIDGNGNQAILISRKNQDDKYLLYAVVTNDIIGVIDCFGFYNISSGELIKVVSKFYQSEGKYKVPLEYVKTKINEAIATNIRLKRKFPYEFICWNVLTSDFNELSSDLKSYSEKNCKKQLMKKDDVLTLFTMDYTLRWFVTPNENAQIKELIDEIYSSEDLDIDYINQKIQENLDKYIDKDNELLWKKRFFDLIYLLKNNDEQKNANKFFTVLTDENYFKLFKQILVQRSVFSHFVLLKDNSKEPFITTNIFRKKNSPEYKYDTKKLEKIISLLRKSWIDE